MSTVLAIDTSSASIAVTLATDGMVVHESLTEAGIDHSRLLLPAIHAALAAAAAPLDVIVVARGPGSYSGLRVGLATASGLASARGIPCLGVPTLEAASSIAGPGSWTIIHPAGRGAFATQPCTDGAATGPIAQRDGATLSGRGLAGEGAVAFGGREIGPAERCRAVLALGAEMLQSGAGTETPSAIYLREPHITVSRKTITSR